MPTMRVFINGQEAPCPGGVVELVYEFSAGETGGDAELLVIQHKPEGRHSELSVDGVTGSKKYESAEHMRREMP